MYILKTREIYDNLYIIKVNFSKTNYKGDIGLYEYMGRNVFKS